MKNILKRHYFEGTSRSEAQMLTGSDQAAMPSQRLENARQPKKTTQHVEHMNLAGAARQSVALKFTQFKCYIFMCLLPNSCPCIALLSEFKSEHAGDTSLTPSSSPAICSALAHDKRSSELPIASISYSHQGVFNIWQLVVHE